MQSPTLLQLAAVRSRLADELIAFLEKIVDVVDRTPWECDGKMLRASSAFVEPRLFAHRKPTDRHEEKDSHGKYRKKDAFPMDEELEALYERKRGVGRNEEKRWNQVVQAGSRLRLSILGEPGGGKTCATRHTVARLARESIRALRECTADVSQVIVPLWITARHLAEQPTGAEPSTVLLGALEHQPGLGGAVTPFLRRWLYLRLGCETVFLVIDALDELHESDTAGIFTRHLGEMENLALSLVVTCRTLPWERLKHSVPWGDDRLAVELKPLEPPEQCHYAATLFEFMGRKGLEAELDHRLSRVLSLREHARTPLILTFACLLLAEGALPEATGLAELYRTLIGALLEGRWRKAGQLPDWTVSSIRRERVRNFLGAICWQLFRRTPTANRFSLDEWDLCWELALPQCKAPQIDADILLDDLVSIGLVVDGGLDEKCRESWSIAHRSVLEFLAAEGLRGDETKMHWLLHVQKPIEENPFWFHPEWLPMLTFLASVVGDATALVCAVEIPPLINGAPAAGDDIFCQMLGLQCRFVGVAGATPDEHVQWVVGKWEHYWGLKWWRRRTNVGFWDIWVRYGRSLAGHPLFETYFVTPFTEHMKSEDSYDMCASAHLLISLGLRNCLDILLSRFQREQHSNKRAYLRYAIKRLSDSCDVMPLLEILKRAEPGYDRIGIIEILGLLGDVAAVPPLVQLLEQTTMKNEIEALVDALAKLGSPISVDPLFRCLESDRYSETHWRISRALAKLLGKTSFEGLVRSLDHAYGDFRRHVADELGNSGNYQAIHFLVTRCEKEEVGRVKVAILQAMSRFRDGSCVTRILNLLNEEANGLSRHRLLQILETFLDQDLVDSLLSQLQKGNGDVIEMTGKIGDCRAIEPISEWLGVPGHRRNAAVALRKLGAVGFAPKLRSQLRRAKDTSERLEIAIALAEFGDRRALCTLVARSRHEKKSLPQSMIIGACGDFPDPSLVSVLLSQLKFFARSKRDRDMYLRRDIVAELGKLGDPRAIEPILSQLSGKEHRSARETMVEALWSLSIRNRHFIPIPGSYARPSDAS